MIDNKWRTISCGCCAGLEWGGEEPRECRDCMGNGILFIRPNGAIASYPGGPWVGVMRPADYVRGTPVDNTEPADALLKQWRALVTPHEMLTPSAELLEQTDLWLSLDDEEKGRK